MTRRSRAPIRRSSIARSPRTDRMAHIASCPRSTPRWRPPVRMGLPMGDLAGGMFGAFAVAGALVRRERTGRGASLDLALLDCQVSLLSYIAQYYWTDGNALGPAGSGHVSVMPYGAYAT